MRRLCFVIRPADGMEYTVEAASIEQAAAMIARSGRRNLFGIERCDGKGDARFYLDRGTGPLWPLGLRAAANELAISGFLA